MNEWWIQSLNPGLFVKKTYVLSTLLYYLLNYWDTYQQATRNINCEAETQGKGSRMDLVYKRAYRKRWVVWVKSTKSEESMSRNRWVVKRMKETGNWRLRYKNLDVWKAGLSGVGYKPNLQQKYIDKMGRCLDRNKRHFKNGEMVRYNIYMFFVGLISI